MTAVLLFDGTCSFCSTCSRVVQRWVRPDCVLVPHQRVDLAGWHLTPEQVRDDVVLARRQGDVVLTESGVPAITAVLATGRAPWPVVAGLLRAPGTDRAYRWVMAHRNQIPGGTPACDLDGAMAVVGAN